MADRRAREESITTARAYVDYIVKARGLRLPPIPPHCLIAHSDALIGQFRQQFPHLTVDIGSRRPSEVHFFSPPQGSPFAAVAAYHGAPMAALLLEELIALGFRQFVTVGPAGYPAGGLAPALRLGDIVLVDDALIYEGTSLHYDPDASNVRPDPASVDRLAGSLARQRVPHRRGRIATTDAIYRETPAFIDEIVAREALAIDMEMSALFSVCRFHHRPIGALLFISDIVGRQAGWDLAFMDDAVNRAEQGIVPVILDFVRTA